MTTNTPETFEQMGLRLAQEIFGKLQANAPRFIILATRLKEALSAQHQAEIGRLTNNATMQHILHLEKEIASLKELSKQEPVEAFMRGNERGNER